ncbi:hypothetical protein EsH8_IX_000248 [Colletotrichum jinshuiense]
MASRKLIAAILLGAGAVSAQQCTFDSITASADLTWCPCEGQFYCAKLDVPLDYSNPDLGRASVPLIKYAAVSNSSDGPYRGMILINPGGPGASGLDMARGNAALLQSVAGSNYDIIGFDCRGVGLSEPKPSCSAGIATRQSEALSRRDAPRVIDDYYNQYIVYGRELGVQCQAQAGADTEAGPHMSTATTARDMISIVDSFAASSDGARTALNSSQLNYYGLSYGTFLGQTFASMFPDRVGHFVVDGVVSPDAFQANFTGHSINHLDGVLGSFFVYCHAAGLSSCPYYTGNTAKDIFERWNASFVQLDARRAETEGWANATEIADALLNLKVGTLTAVVSPLLQFGVYAKVLVSLEEALASGNLSTWTEQAQAIYGDPNMGGYVDPEETLGVMCSDQSNKWYGKSLEDIQPLIRELQDQSIVGEVWARSMLGCLGWPIASNDVFRGPYGGNTAHPILFVSNTFDPTTPIDNTIANAPKYTNARTLIVDSMGHGLSATNNLCAYGTLKTYFQDTMCGQEHYCPAGVGPFNIQLNGTIQENLEAAGLSDLRSLY